MDAPCSIANNIIIALPATIAAAGAFISSIRNRKHIQGVAGSINGELTKAIQDASAHGTAAGLMAAGYSKNGPNVAATERTS